jgi:hypothetical protein
MNKSMTGIEAIKKERERQLNEEGWSPEHDDSHIDHEMAFAAACYALPKGIRDCIVNKKVKLREWLWSWADNWWKPAKDGSIDERMRELEKAGALCAAEWDRLRRLKIEHGLKNLPND